MCVQYSVVCDTDRDAYLEYLRTVREFVSHVGGKGLRATSSSEVRLTRLLGVGECGVAAFERAVGEGSSDGCGRLAGCVDSEVRGEHVSTGGGTAGFGAERVASACVGDKGACESERVGERVGDVDGVRDGLRGVVGSGKLAEACDVKRGFGATEVGSRGKNWARNRAWKEEKRRKKAGGVPAWRVGAAPLSPPSSVATVSTRTAEEIEAARTLAMRRTVENKVAIAQGNFRLKSYADKDKTEVLKRLEVARIEERINTTKAKSQASYKKCASPLESVGSARSAGEFAWKQEIRKRDALKVERDYLEKQLEKAMLFLPEEGKRAIAEMPEPYIPSDEDIAAEDADICPYLSYEEMEAEAEKFIGAGVRW